MIVIASIFLFSLMNLILFFTLVQGGKKLDPKNKRKNSKNLTIKHKNYILKRNFILIHN